MQNNLPVIKVADIETAPIEAQTWGLFDQNIGLEQIVRDQCILSYAVKNLGKKQVRYVDTFEEDHAYNDLALCQALWQELDEADFIIAHNGKKFDVKKINARFIFHGLPPPSPYIVIDTLLEVRRVAGFTSNKLEYLTGKLCKTHKKLKHGHFPGFMLWKEYLLGNPKARAEMKRYNIADITSLEELYMILRPWMLGHPNLTTFVDSDTPACPCCGSKHVEKRGVRHTSVSRYQRYQCNDCGGWSRGRFSMRQREHNKALLVK